MRMLGYGEDGLTLTFLGNSLGDCLNVIGDDSHTDDCKVIYRASFGRKRGIGEVDAIILTCKAIYLCESKWNPHENSKRCSLVLAPKQARRDEKLAKIISAWRKYHPQDWDHFRNVLPESPDLTLPAARTVGARNLEAVCRIATNHPGQIRKVILYFHRSDHIARNPVNVTPRDYEVHKVRYGLAGLFNLPGGGEDSDQTFSVQ